MDYPGTPDGFGSGGQYTGSFSGVGVGNFYAGAPGLTLPNEAWTTAAQTTNASTHFNYACVPLVPNSNHTLVADTRIDRLALYQHVAFIVHHRAVDSLSEIKKRLQFASDSETPIRGLKRLKPNEFGLGPTGGSYLEADRRPIQFEEASIVLNAPTVNFLLASQCKGYQTRNWPAYATAYDIPPVHWIIDLIRPLGVCVTVPNQLAYGKDYLDVRAFCLRGPADIHDVFGGNAGKNKHGRGNPYFQIVRGMPLYYVLSAEKVTAEERNQMTFKPGNGQTETINQYDKAIRWVIRPWAPLDGTFRPPSLEDTQRTFSFPSPFNPAVMKSVTVTGYYWRVGVVHEPTKRHDVVRETFTRYNIGVDDGEAAYKCPLMSIHFDFVGPEMGAAIPVVYT